MKKKYVSPRIMVIEIESTALLAGSGSDQTPEISVSKEWADEDSEVL